MPVMLDAPTREFLERPYVGILATVSPKGRPQATPVWFMLEGNRIMVNTRKGRAKLRNLEHNGRAVLTVVDPHDMYRYIEIRGKVVGFDQVNGGAGIDRLSRRYQGRAYSYPSTDGPENRVTILIEPLAVSGMNRR